MQVRLTKKEVLLIKLLLNHTMKELKHIDGVFAGPDSQKLMSTLEAATAGHEKSAGGSRGSVRSLSAAAYPKTEPEEVATLPQMRGV
jgi:hypothetical protein